MPDTSGLAKRLEDIGQSLVQLAGELQQCVEDVKTLNARQLEQERASSILAASVEAQVVGEQVPLQNINEDTESKKVRTLQHFFCFKAWCIR